eukprot:TRINITY_DN1410_c0_g1_i7.p1 TRINITY_DN1410_c0_g1~~TRINITY_DN1410_c0_g1_i7.p1  ORF type:complete len:153 (+),score=19.24 TRINITY_DN1410_c0_g1_i7:80-538(+)
MALSMFSVVSLLSCSIFRVTSSPLVPLPSQCPGNIPVGGISAVDVVNDGARLAEPIQDVVQHTDSLQQVASSLNDDVSNLEICFFIQRGHKLFVTIAGTNGKCTAIVGHEDETRRGKTHFIGLKCTGIPSRGGGNSRGYDYGGNVYRRRGLA